MLNNCCNKHFLALTCLFASAFANAGIDTDLYQATHENCVIEVQHSVVPDSNIGTLLFRVYQVVDGLHRSCEISADSATTALSKGLQALKARNNLAPISSIRIGRLQDYRWIRQWFAAQHGQQKRLNYQAFNRLVSRAEISAPFVQAIHVNGFAFKQAACEKIIYFDYGAPQDAFCWLRVQAN